MKKMIELTRIVVVGIGGITPLGEGTFWWPKLLVGQNGIGMITRFDPTGFDCQIAGEVKDFDPEKFISKKEARRMDRVIQFGVAATKLALDDAGLSFPLDEDLAPQTGVIVGSGIGGLETYETQHKIFLEKGAARVSPFLIPMYIPNMVSGIVGIYSKATGPNFAINSACATGSHAIGEGFRYIRFNKISPPESRITRMIVGASEAAITPLSIVGFSNMKALTTSHNSEPEKASRPFDKTRDGFVMGEGSVVLILEDLEVALARGAKIYCELVGYAATCDANHITAPDPEGKGAAGCMQLALEDAGIDAKDINYINPHGSSTPLNDRIETSAIKKVFGNYAYQIPTSSTKSMLGHLLGAAGSLEAAVTALSVYNGAIHPTINCEFSDPDCDLDYVTAGSRQVEIEYAMSNSFGFGGHNAVLIFEKYQPK